MWSQVLYALVAALLLYALISVVLKVIEQRLRPTSDPAVDGKPGTGDVRSQRPN
ncbi:hypothetical protein [Phycicoccus sp. Soil803]|uniref:hypothetical protein n=1 Tax=Phycicoccus sp. Soil803 TaxID=1736415 RepID=UPI000A4049E6|nr:hypothetical protein [Phycicoccus sp. Soil803]